jgi:hypothetical protein
MRQTRALSTRSTAKFLEIIVLGPRTAKCSSLKTGNHRSQDRLGSLKLFLFHSLA